MLKYPSAARTWRQGDEKGVNEVSKSTPREIFQHSFLGGFSPLSVVKSDESQVSRGHLIRDVVNPSYAISNQFLSFLSKSPAWRSVSFFRRCDGFSPSSLISANFTVCPRGWLSLSNVFISSLQIGLVSSAAKQIRELSSCG